MNKIWKKLFILPLALAALVAPLRAQTDDSISNGPSPATAAASPTTPTQSPPQMTPAPAAIPEQHDSYHPDPDDMIPIFGIVGVFGGGTVICAMFFYFRHRRNKMLHETLRAMIDKGVPIPPELLAAPQQNAPPRPRNDLRMGLVLIAIGFGLSSFIPGPERKFGFIPLFIGLAFVISFLIAWKMEQKKKDQPGK